MPGAGEQISLKTLGEDKPVRTHKVDKLEVSSLHGNHCFSLDIFPQSLIPVSKDKITTQQELRLWQKKQEPTLPKPQRLWEQGRLSPYTDYAERVGPLALGGATN